MSSVVTVPQESMEHGGFYVPRFELRVVAKDSGSADSGQSVTLPEAVLRDIEQVTYTDNLKGIDSVELTVNNWDPIARDFKYVGFDYDAKNPPAADTEQGRRLTMFEPCNREFELHLGYLTDLKRMMRGTFTTLAPSFPTGGKPTLTVRGLNVLHKLRRKQYSKEWGDIRDSDIAENIQTLRDNGRKRFPLPIEINDTARDDEEPRPYVAQKNQYDIDFLFGLAKRNDYVVVVSEGDERNRNRHLYFGPSQTASRDVTYELKWQQSLISFSPTLTTANQIKSVTVRGWNRRRKRAVQATANLNDRRLNRNQDLRDLIECCRAQGESEAREEMVVDEPVSTEREARNRAIAILAGRQKEMVTASGSTVGLPDLHAGRNVVIDGFGPRFSGTYFVTETTHTLDDGGYTTSFKARREHSSS